jgi:branched-chain amino acid transport system ATP-binding protein
MIRLNVSELHAHYGQSHVLQGVTFNVKSGSITTILGRNGSGRSTTLKALMGIVAPSGGSVRFGDIELAGLSSTEISRSGIAYVPEERLVFPNLTVYENLLVGQQRPRLDTTLWTIDEMYRYFPRLSERRNQLAGTLSGGEQQMLTICRSLLGNPSIILIDEPTEGLAPQIVTLLREVLVEIKNRGVTILLVEQKLTMALEISDYVWVMGHGQMVYGGTVSEFTQNDDVRKSWLDVT